MGLRESLAIAEVALRERRYPRLHAYVTVAYDISMPMRSGFPCVHSPAGTWKQSNLKDLTPLLVEVRAAFTRSTMRIGMLQVAWLVPFGHWTYGAM